MKHVILFVGSLQSGKTTSAAAIDGYHLTHLGHVPNCSFDENGRMSIIYDKANNTGIYLDIDTENEQIIDFMRQHFWANVRHFSFATQFKDALSKIFSIDRNCFYGTNDQKNQETHIEWNNILPLLSPKRFEELKHNAGKKVTGRQLMQVFGTDICRAIDEPCHIRAAFQAAKEADPDIAIFPDGRFEDEVEFFDNLKKSQSEYKVWLIKLKRMKFKSNDPMEQGAAGIPDSRYDLVIDNENMTTLEKNEKLVNFLVKRGVLSPTNIERI